MGTLDDIEINLPFLVTSLAFTGLPDVFSYMLYVYIYRNIPPGESGKDLLLYCGSM